MLNDDVGKLVANASYDEGADVLYFSMGDPSPAASGEEYGPFVIRRGADGSIVGITIIDASHLINSRKAPDMDALLSAIASCEAWIDRWTSHVGRCEGGDKCTCGRTAVLSEARAAIIE